MIPQQDDRRSAQRARKGAIRRIATSTPAEAAAAAALLLAGSAVAVQRKTAEAERETPPLGQFLTVEGVRLHYLERGEGDPVVILHGNGAMVEEMVLSGVISALSQRYRVVVIDRPGYGHSERPRDRLWTPAAQAALILRALDRLGVERPILVGHSWGTLVAVAAALGRPSKVRALVLMAGFYYRTPRADVALFSPPAIPGVGDLMRYTVAPVAGRLIWPLMMRKIFGPKRVPRRFAEEFPKWMALRPSQLRASASEAAMMLPSAKAWQGRYRELRMPVAILAGESDRLIDPERQSTRLHRDIPGSTLRLLPGLGHMFHHYAPGAVAEAVDEVARFELRPERPASGR